MTAILRKSLTLALGGMILAAPALAGNQHSAAVVDFNTERGNGLAKLSANGSGWSSALVIDPSQPAANIPPLDGPKFKSLRESLQRVQDSYRNYRSRLEKKLAPEATMSVDQWWATLSSADKNTLSQYGVNALNAGGASIAPYYSKDSNGAPRQLFVVDQDFFDTRTLASYKNKNVTKYRTEYYSYPVYVASGCYCPPRLAYYATGSRQVAYTDTTSVPASFQVAVEAVTPHKLPQDVDKVIQVAQNYTVSEPVYVDSGCYCGPRLAYYRNVTRTRYVNATVTETVLKDQVTVKDDQGRNNLFAPPGSTPDANGNITFSTDADGNITFVDASSAANNFSSSNTLVSNPGLPRPPQ